MRRVAFLLALAAALVPGAAHARLAVEVWTDRGKDAVYKPGDLMQIQVRSTEDANALVYEIDAEGYIHVLFPDQGGAGFLEGRRTYQLPPERSDVELVVREPVGQCYIVAIASMNPLDDLPWYLRPYNAQAAEVGYVGAPEEEEGVTAEGRIVGDPFVAMERIRRRVLKDSNDGETFATAYTSYYVHEAVRYPRYLCYDCHRPGHWAWWDGFDPYYTTCSVFDVRVNWSWYWGPRYWYGYVPYFVFAYRPDCPPRYYPYYQNGGWCSSWDGWSTWCNLWGTGTLRRFKSPPPPGYTPPSKFGRDGQWRPGASNPPGFLVGNVRAGRGVSPLLPVGRSGEVRHEGGGVREQRPVSTPRREERPAPAVRSPRQEIETPYTPRTEEAPVGRSPREAGSRYTPRGLERPAPVDRSPRQESAPRYEPRGGERPTPAMPAPREESARRHAPKSEERPAPATQAPRQERSAPPAEHPRSVGEGDRSPARGQAQSPRGGAPSRGGRGQR